MEPMPDGVITVVLADDNLIVRAGVRALLAREADIEVVGEAADHPELLAAAAEHEPQVVVTDIRMPPTFQREGIDAAKEIRQRHPGTGIVILSPVRRPRVRRVAARRRRRRLLVPPEGPPRRGRPARRRHPRRRHRRHRCSTR